MFDPIRKLQAELRTSTGPISTFFLIEKSAQMDIMAEKLRLLYFHGVTASQIDAAIFFTARVLTTESPERDFERRTRFLFRLEGEDSPFKGSFDIRNVPGKGFEVELIMPGIVASNVPAFFENGFFTAFMPPSFYD
jgi:hypothetical protein